MYKFRSLALYRGFSTGQQAISRARRRIQTLKRLVKKYNDYYFNKSMALVPDEEYDKTFRELVDLEAEFPELALVDSPTQRVGATPRKVGAALVNHVVPMLSLANTYSPQELAAFAEKCGPSNQFTTEAKYDGVAVSLTYSGGRISRAATRGDGKTGHQITEAILAYTRVPAEVPFEDDFEVRGEFVIPREVLKDSESVSSYAHGRSLVSGLLSKHEPVPDFTGKIDLVIYNMITSKQLQTHMETLQLCRVVPLL